MLLVLLALLLPLLLLLPLAFNRGHHLRLGAEYQGLQQPSLDHTQTPILPVHVGAVKVAVVGEVGPGAAPILGHGRLALCRLRGLGLIDGQK